MRKFSSMTWADFKQAVADADFPDDLQVAFTANYGDYGKGTMQALRIDGDFTVREIEETGYSNSGFGLVDEDSESDKVVEDNDTEGTGRCDRCRKMIGEYHGEPCSLEYAEREDLPQKVLVIE